MQKLCTDGLGQRTAASLILLFRKPHVTKGSLFNKLDQMNNRFGATRSVLGAGRPVPVDTQQLGMCWHFNISLYFFGMVFLSLWMKCYTYKCTVYFFGVVED